GYSVMFSKQIELARKKHPAFDRVLTRFEAMHTSALRKQGRSSAVGTTRNAEALQKLDATVKNSGQRLSRTVDQGKAGVITLIGTVGQWGSGHSITRMCVFTDDGRMFLIPLEALAELDVQYALLRGTRIEFTVESADAESVLRVLRVIDAGETPSKSG